MPRLITLVVFLFAFAPQQRSTPRPAAASPPAHITHVELQVSKLSRIDGKFHWKISNHNNVSVYAYSTYLWGPALHLRRMRDADIFETTPTEKAGGGCPDNYQPPLMLQIPPNDYREGDFEDPAIKELSSSSIAFRIAIGPEPTRISQALYRVVKDCRQNPFDVLYDWATILESPPVPAGQ